MGGGAIQAPNQGLYRSWYGHPKVSAHQSKCGYVNIHRFGPPTLPESPCFSKDVKLRYRYCIPRWLFNLEWWMKALPHSHRRDGTWTAGRGGRLYTSLARTVATPFRQSDYLHAKASYFTAKAACAVRKKCTRLKVPKSHYSTGLDLQRGQVWRRL